MSYYDKQGIDVMDFVRPWVNGQHRTFGTQTGSNDLYECEMRVLAKGQDSNGWTMLTRW